MGFRLTIDGSGPVSLSEKCVTNVEFHSEIPADSNASYRQRCSPEGLGQAAVFAGGGGSGRNGELGKVEHCTQRFR